MRADADVGCQSFPCSDMRHDAYQVPGIDICLEHVSIIMIAEAAPAQPGDYFYAGDSALFAQTTVLSFREAGVEVSSMRDILEMGVYVTTAVKCAKTSYGIATGTVKECSGLLERELALFPNARVLMLMGDVAIKAVNAIAQRHGEPRPVPAGPTYKIRGQPYAFRGMRVFPSYLQAGPSFFIEKGKHRVIAEDISTALALVAGTPVAGA